MLVRRTTRILIIFNEVVKLLNLKELLNNLMLNNYLDLILLIAAGIILTIFYLLLVKAVTALINFFFNTKDNLSLYKSIYITNYYRFINEDMLKYFLELYLGFLNDSFYPKYFHTYEISIIIYQINPATKEYYPISDKCTFDYQLKKPITVEELYPLIEWFESEFDPDNDIIILFKTH